MPPALPLLVLALGSIALLWPVPLRAANADHPYQNVDPRNDLGNDTGDSRVDRLNQAQLDENQHPPVQHFASPTAPPPAVPPGTVVLVPTQ